MRAGLGTALMVTGMLLGRAHAADETPGRAEYLQYCSACHGSEARGDGPAAAALNPKPADLTRIASRNGGNFPFTRVKESIDGRNPIVAHGRPAMPVWGQVFREDTAATMMSPMQVRGRVQLITSYLATIQAH